MKKRLLAAAVAAMITLSAASVFAAPNVETNGDVKLHYRWNTEDGAADKEGGKFWLRLNVKAQLDDKTDAYLRFAHQKLTGDNVGADFNQEYSNYDEDSATSLDRFGVVYKNSGWTYNLGRQGATVGALATLFSTEGYMGIRMGAVEGLSVTGKSGVTDIKFIGGRLWDDRENKEDKVYALQASYSPAKDWTVGAIVGKYNYADATKDDTNHWAVNTAYTVGKATYLAEYTKSNADNNDTAYALGATYAFDKKNSAYAFYSRVEANGDMGGGWTDFDNNQKGLYLGYDYVIDKDTTFSLFYKDMTYISGEKKDKDNTSFRTTVTYKF
ncbi:porin [Sporolituus thermophilus]|uniref:Porin n=1 Tax=Sporolituus thermophilus DSM 23256 TaxID=1123285 RepID=A0A1G7NF93_9FIRM|nr:porin [Sporolituus thermophilus]SDF72626.1 porin [Sporolituus thermophilus DSM 23256]